MLPYLSPIALQRALCVIAECHYGNGVVGLASVCNEILHYLQGVEGGKEGGRGETGRGREEGMKEGGRKGGEGKESREAMSRNMLSGDTPI